MDSRRILELKKDPGQHEMFSDGDSDKIVDKLRIFVDSKSLDMEFSNNYKIEIFLSYHKSKFYEFFRSPYNSRYNEINQISSYFNSINREKNTGGIYYHRKNTHVDSHVAILENVDIVSKEIFKKEVITQDEWDSIWLIFVQSSFTRSDHRTIFVTEDQVLLKNRRWFESHIPGGQLNIMTTLEVIEIMDLFAKYREMYHISNFYTANRGLWYLTSFRNKIRHFHFETPILHSFAYRFMFVLRCIDEIGIQFYLGVNNDTEDEITYHFNYFISLVTGIFDSLAIETRTRLQITFNSDDNPSRTSLRNTVGKEFLQSLNEKNSQLRQHINDHVDFINLIYELREAVIHREILGTIQYGSFGGTRNQEYSFFKIPKSIMELTNRLGDKPKELDIVSQWGIHKDELGYKISPYDFVKTSTTLLTKFTDKYLELLGFQNYFNNIHAEDYNRDHVFSTERLGF